MSQNKKQETPVEEVNTSSEETSPKGAKKGNPASLRDAWRQVESFGQTLSEALQGRGNVVMVRVNDEALKHLDMLVEAKVTKSRSESAAFLINEGTSANQELFDRIKSITDQISALREQLHKDVNLDIEQ